MTLCQIDKRHNFLQFEFVGFGSESQHLRQPSVGDSEQQVKEALELRSQGKSKVTIAAHFGAFEGEIRKWGQNAEESVAPF